MLNSVDGEIPSCRTVKALDFLPGFFDFSVEVCGASWFRQGQRRLEFWPTEQKLEKSHVWSALVYSEKDVCVSDLHTCYRAGIQKTLDSYTWHSSQTSSIFRMKLAMRAP